MNTNANLARLVRSGLAAAIAPALMMGCYAAEPDNLANDPTTLIASAVSEDIQVDFIEPIPGEILLVSDGDLLAAAGITEDELGRLDVVDVYERIAGEPAPDELLEARRRSEEIARLADADDDLDAPAITPARDPAIGKRSQLTATEFDSLHCPSGSYAFFYCMTNRTGYAERTEKSDWARFTAHSYRGTIRMNLEVKSGLNWNQVYSSTVTEDDTDSVYSWSSGKTNRRISVDQAAGDGYHYAFFGAN